MKKTFISLLFLAFCGGQAMGQSLTSGIDKANLDTSVKPGDDFFQYAVGGWLKSHPLDEEHPMNGSFVDLSELNNERILGIIQEYSSTPQPQGTLGQKIGSLYNLAMDSDRLNREGYEPLKPYLQRVASAKSKKALELLCAEYDLQGMDVMMFSVGCGADMRDADNNLVSIGQGGLGLPNRDYYFKDDAQTVKIREAYKTMMKNLFVMTGTDANAAQKKVDAVYAIEKRIASKSYDPVKLRDVDANYHKMRYEDLLTDFPGIDWGNFFLRLGFPAFEYVDVGQPEPVHEVEKIWAETSLDDLKAYVESRVISSATSALSDDFRAEAFKYSSIMMGTQQDRPRWKRAVSTVSGSLGEAVGKLYVEKYFPEANKQRMLELVRNLQVALSQRIDGLTWMSAATKAQAKDKLQNFIVKIGYPDKWKNYDALQIDEKLYTVTKIRVA